MSTPGRAALASTGLVAADLCLMAHDDVTGRSFLQPRAAGLGPAGGMLAEQILPGSLTIWQGRVVVAGSPPPRDLLGCRVAGLVRGEREQHPVRDWLAYLARTRPALAAAGTATCYGTVLAGLAVACGLGPRLLPHGPPDGRRHLDLAVERLPPGLRLLIVQVQAAVEALRSERALRSFDVPSTISRNQARDCVAGAGDGAPGARLWQGRAWRLSQADASSIPSATAIRS